MCDADVKMYFIVEMTSKPDDSKCVCMSHYYATLWNQSACAQHISL